MIWVYIISIKSYDCGLKHFARLQNIRKSIIAENASNLYKSRYVFERLLKHIFL